MSSQTRLSRVRSINTPNEWRASTRSAIHVRACVWFASVCFAPAALAEDGAAGGAKPAPPPDAPAVRLFAAPYTPTHFSPEILLGHVYYLASDELGGRGTGTPGIERAGRYIADQFASAGIEPGGDDGTFFQNLEIDMGAELTEDGEFKVLGLEGDAPVLNTDYVPFSFSTGDAFEGPVVFAGYGIVEAERKWDDYAGLDTAGKVVLMLRREPTSWSGGARGASRASRFDAKVETAKKHGAAAVLIVNQKPDEGAEERLVPFGGRGRGDYGLPAFQVTRALADRMLAAGGMDTIEELQDRLDAEEPVHSSAPLNGVNLRGRAGLKRTSATARNVVGVIHGKGPLAGEYLVISAHYDHLGTAASRSMFGRQDQDAEKQIHNGADDNASGTAGLIELGKALVRQQDLKRSVLLAAFTGEEMGLLGSEHYVEHPSVPLEKIVACVNMDMIGRMEPDSNKFYVYGTGTATGFEELVLRAATEEGLQVDEIKASSGQSDEASFYEKQIPSMHFFTGMHPDYHRPTDDSDKVNEQDAVRALAVVGGVVWQIINAEQRPVFQDVGGFAGVRQGNRVVMGIYPEDAAESAEKGLRVARVVPDGPAQKAGMKDGDCIVRIQETAVGGMDDFRQALRQRKAGDSVQVIVHRGEEEVTLTVTLGSG